MSTGLVLRVSGVNGLGVIYACDVWTAQWARELGQYTTMNGARDALAHFLRLARTMKYEPEWVSGNSANLRDARKLGLEHRKRVPGGGRKRLGDTKTKIRRTYWLTQAGAAAIVAAAATSGRTLGEEIESRFLSDNQ